MRNGLKLDQDKIVLRVPSLKSLADIIFNGDGGCKVNLYPYPDSLVYPAFATLLELGTVVVLKNEAMPPHLIYLGRRQGSAIFFEPVGWPFTHCYPRSVASYDGKYYVATVKPNFPYILPWSIVKVDSGWTMFEEMYEAEVGVLFKNHEFTPLRPELIRTTNDAALFDGSCRKFSRMSSRFGEPGILKLPKEACVGAASGDGFVSVYAESSGWIVCSIDKDGVEIGQTELGKAPWEKASDVIVSPTNELVVFDGHSSVFYKGNDAIWRTRILTDAVL
jgi:hypothetical protein